MNAMAMVNEGRFFPSGSDIRSYVDGNIVVGFYEASATGRPAAIAYKGKAKRPFAHYFYRNELEREQAVDRWVTNYMSDVKRKEEAKARRKEANQKAIEAVQVGDIFASSWGYEQTNVCFYQVVEKKGSMAVLKEIAGSLVEAESGMSGYKVPVKDAFLKNAEPMKKKIQGDSWSRADEARPYFKINSVEDAYPHHEGAKHFCSWWY